MELITFNTWGGRLGEQPIRDFCTKYRDTDIFCFQEIWETENLDLIDDPSVDINLLSKISTYLPEHRFYFRPQFRGIYGLATFVHERHVVEDEGELFVFKDQGYENPMAMGNHARNLQYLHLKVNGNKVSVINFHGLWNGAGKSDTPDRIEQSSKIANFMKHLSHPFLIAGDFNLEPGTESLRIIEEVCPRNLVRDFGVCSTRSSHYQKPGKFADYIFLSLHLKAGHFEVLPDVASDHLALKVKIEHCSTETYEQQPLVQSSSKK